MTETHYLKMVKVFGVYHAIAILPFAFPVFTEHVLNLLGAIHTTLNLSGTWMDASPSYLMFVNLFACAALVWALYRVFHPSEVVGRYEGWGMLLFSFIVLFYVYNGASAIWLLIPLIDLPGGFMHLFFLSRRDA